MLRSIIVSMAGAPGVLLGAVLVEIPQLGRKWAMVFSSAMMAASLLLYTTVTTFEGSVRLNAMEYFCKSSSPFPHLTLLIHDDYSPIHVQRHPVRLDS
jgi:hypothetical protein